MKIKHKVKSSDTSTKYILETFDGLLFECIYMPHEQEDAIVMCLSCQIGCVNKCTHCATGKVDYVRDLTSKEICEEVEIMIADNDAHDQLLAVLFMGMGEPFLNYDNVINGIDLIEKKFDIIDENVTISTVGVVHKIRELADLNRNIRLAVSIHATNEEERNSIIPLNKIFSLKNILDAIDYYTKKTQKKVLMQYTLIGGVNDSDKACENLISLAKTHDCEVRIIPFNPSPSIIYSETTNERVEYFCNQLQINEIDYVLSRSRGVDVSGGCGQLYLHEV